jgi:DNA primase
MRIRREDVEHVREQSRVEEIVGEYVTLKGAGVGSLKGLCPFHDERTPSFHVRPPVGRWHCFGCGEDGDVIDFVQKVDHLTFTEAVERLAARLGFPLRYEDDSGGRAGARREQVGQRQRLVEANRLAAQFFAEQLLTSADALAGRQFLIDRGFDQAAAEHFGIGFAPRPGEALLRHLRGRGFTEDELFTSGLAGRGQRGLYDRFRGRLIWPIRDVTGDVVGFGARRLFDDDRIQAKYLNTPETPLYHKSQVLYGVDLAKREIARSRKVVIVEGYTDVMACHLAGVGTAVATCGTAFGGDHVRVVRRLLGDDSARAGEVVFTFDGDAAGQAAARKAFSEDQHFVAQTSVAIAQDGMDPCDLRLVRGDDAVHALIDSRQPLYRFAILSALDECNLDTAEGRAHGLRVAAPMVARIREETTRNGYVRQVAGWLSLPEGEVQRQVRAARRTFREAADRRGSAPGTERPRGGPPGTGRSDPGTGVGSGAGTGPGPDTGAGAGTGSGSGGQRGDGNGDGTVGLAMPDSRDPVVRAEREALACLLQVPQLLPAGEADALGEQAFDVPAFRAVHQAVRAAGGIAYAQTLDLRAWTEAVLGVAPPAVAPLVSQLVVAPLPTESEEGLSRYAVSVLLGVAESEVVRRISTLRSRLQRTDPGSPEHQQAFADLMAAEERRRSLFDRRVNGG